MHTNTYTYTHKYTNTNTEIHIHTYVTKFWKTDQIVTLGLFILLAQLMATLVHYTYTLSVSGLVNWFTFLE